MSNRHRGEQLRDRAGTDRQARAERHQVRTGLHQLRGAVTDDEVDNLDAPPVGRPPHHHHDHTRKRRTSPRSKFAHWKQKSWKRRANQRAERVAAERALQLGD